MLTPWDRASATPELAVQRLIDGNRRFREASSGPRSDRTWSSDHAQPQSPFAIVLGCSDSRTPVEILFDQGFGDLFVVRIAGNIVAPSGVGSIEFAAATYGTPLVVVMGHTLCGAVAATVDVIKTGTNPNSKNIMSITDRIAPHIASLFRGNKVEAEGQAALMREAVRANVRASADHLRHGSRLLEELVGSGKLAVVGAEYEIETGTVHFFDGVPSGVVQNP